MGVGARIKQILKLQGKTIAWLAEESKVSINSLYTITKRDDTTVAYDNLKKIAGALKIDPWVLIEEDKDERIKRDKRIYTENLSETITPFLGMQLIEPFLKKREIEIVPMGEKQLFFERF